MNKESSFKVVSENTLLEGDSGKIISTRFADGNRIVQFVPNIKSSTHFTVGTTCKVQIDYNQGASSWVHSSLIISPKGMKLQVHGDKAPVQEIVCPVVVSYNKNKAKKK